MKYEQLIDLNFTNIGYWKTDGKKLNHEVLENMTNELDVENSLYVFFDKEKDRILYVGKTTRTLRKRFKGYIRGDGISTNNKVHNNLLKQKSGNVLILSLNNESHFQWGKYNLNLAAGLEDSMIEIENPLWNGKCSETKLVEESTLEEITEVEDTFFIVSLYKTYLEFGSINVPFKKSNLLGDHNEDVTIKLSKSNKQIKTKINRKAVKNGSVRINANKDIREYYNNFYNLGCKVKIIILNKHNIVIE